MEWANVKTAGIDVTHQIDLPVGASGGAFGFFIIADGNNKNGGYSGLDVTGDGTLSFVYNYGKADQRAANINDSGGKISLVYDDGATVRVLKGDVYFTTERGESASINRDGKVHVVSGLMGESEPLPDHGASDLGSKAAGVTIAPPPWAAHGGSPGVNASELGSKFVFGGGDALHAGLASSAENIISNLMHILGGNTGIGSKNYIEASPPPFTYDHSVSSFLGTKAAGILDTLFNGSIPGISHPDNVQPPAPAPTPGALDTDTLRIGFEDLRNAGDADYDDVLFDLNINPVQIGDIGGGNDLLDGGAGADILYGEGGDDILVLGNGYDQANGGAGADTFAVTMIDAFVDKIHDFNASEGDVINIADVLDSYDPLSDDIADFVQLVQNGSDTELQISAHGDGSFAAAALIVGGTDDALATLIANGALVADQTALA
jgi:Ca2+-binding RTX toxin-like protein